MRDSRRATAAWLALALLAIGLARPEGGEAALSAELEKQLVESKYVYVSSQRKDGSFSPPAEIWFMVHDGAVWVGTRSTSWRARRIKAGRTAAVVRVGSSTGPSFEAAAAIVDDKAIWQVLFAKLAAKYPDGWPTHERSFRDGAASGARVLIRYTPK